MVSRDPDAATSRPAERGAGDGASAAPDYYSHGLNRIGCYRVAAAVAGALPRPARRQMARGLGRLLARAVPVERHAVRANLSRVLARATGAVVAALERVIRAYPTPWFNFFDAWSPSHGHA
jgi:lauroyl/myristoyl acyltransferase